MAAYSHPLGIRNSIKTTISVFLIFAGCLLIYSNSFYVPFTFDDRPFIINDTSVHLTDLSVSHLIKAVCEGYPGQRPLSNISFAVNYYFSNLQPFGYHLVNILIHSLSGIFLFFLLQNTITLAQPGIFCRNDLSGLSRKGPFDSQLIAFLAVLVWLFHPLHTESVTYICQRMTSLAGMFYVLSIWLYVKGRLSARFPDKTNHRQIILFLGSAAAGGLAVLSKPNAATLPVMILFYEWAFFQNFRLDWFKRRFMWIILVLCLVCVFSILFLGNTPIDRILSAYAHRDFTLLQRVLTESRVIVYYLSLIVFPSYQRLNLDYDYPISTFLIAPSTTVIAIMAIIGLLGLAVYSSKKEPFIGFAVFWFLANLIIESSVIGLEIIFEHRTYLPSMFLIAAMAVIIFRFCQSDRIAVVIFCMIIFIEGLWTWQRNEIWQDELILWQDCVEKSPEKARSYYNLGCLLSQKNQLDQSISYFYKAAVLEPGSSYVHYNLGCELAKIQSNKQAMAHFSKVLALDPNHADAHTNMANILSELGKQDRAIGHYRKAAALRPKNQEYLSNLGAALFSKGMVEDAIIYYQKAYQLKPDNITILNRLGYALFSWGKTDESIPYYMKVLELSPNNAEANGKMGDVLMRKKEYHQAISHYIKALKKNPNDAQSHYNLGIAYSRTDRLKQAEGHFKQAIKISPDLQVP
ncbi:MAG: tetratricopeptide repeat protein [Desulfobacteraceae bacterium]|nr:tetratricopeptide repeat protein [Desulfobacteraceae bacterium]